MTAPLVVITDSNLPTREVEEEVLAPAGFRVERADCTNEAEVVDAAAGADAVIVQWAPVTDDVLEQLQRCRLVSRLGIGIDMVDVEAATRRGIAVSNTPDYCVEEVAAHTIALALSLSRRLAPLEASLRRGEWAVAANAPGVRRPSASVFAVIGFGRIGSRVAQIAAALGYDVVVFDPVVPAEEIAALGYRSAGFEEVLAAAQVVSLHAPLTGETFHLLDESALRLMGADSFLVNTSRGELVDEVALARALEAGAIGGAGIDVFEREPLAGDSPLRGAPNVVLTPHAAWYSDRALEELPRRAAENVVAFFAGEPTSLVNPTYALTPRAVVA